VGAEDLWRKFEDSNDQPLKGYIAISLGLMRVNSKAEKFRELITTKGLEPKFRLNLARALGLMSDTQAVPTLIDYLQSAETQVETATAAQALGLIGDRSAVDPLLAILKNKSKQPQSRGFAAVALGLIAEKTSLPWNAVFSVNSNYRAKVNALSEILDIL
jgi:HEAT repeat protein